MRRAFCVSIGILLVAVTSTGRAQDEEELDTPPGLLARYTAGERTVERIDPDLAFQWGAAAPDSRLPAGPFTAEWSSLLLLRQEGTYTFHAYVEGEVAIALDGREVLKGSQPQAGWVSGPAVDLGFGEKELTVRYRRTGNSARLQVFWSSSAFHLEPLPAHLLYREEPNEELAKVERGRVLFDAHRCNRCHRREHAPLSAPAPALMHVATGSDPGSLITKILDPHRDDAGARMPSFGFREDEARAVAAFLLETSKPVKLDAPAKVDEKDRAKDLRAGEVLFRSTGCLACHRVGEQGKFDPYGGGDLSAVGQKRSVEWLTTWLANPAKLNPDHRMPVFALEAKQRSQVVRYLASLQGEKPREAAGQGQAPKADSPGARSKDSDEARVSHGRKLVEDARCAACHRIEGMESPPVATLPALSRVPEDWEKTCLSETADRAKTRPAYSGIDREALIAYLTSHAGPVAPESAFARGERVLERRNCLSCHERGTGRGMVEIAGRIAGADDALKGQSQGLIPPALTAVGDKLKDEALATAVSGEQKNVRLPWLHVKMPRFEHTAEDKAALLAYFVEHDRIPAGAPESTTPASGSTPNAQQSANAQVLVTGQTLVGAKGFSCLACHEIGSYVPKNVALGTRGSNLVGLGERMRREYYLRWTRSPARIVPGMEMPSYIKPVPGVLGENLDAQLLATWDALNDPRFVPPTNPAVVEQYLVVQPNDPPRIVRDVFTLPKEDGGNVARAMAIGFSNGHNLLFDLDHFALRAWTFGDFARQRTEGKSWYWDLAGVPVVKGWSGESDLALRSTSGTRELIRPQVRHGMGGQLLEYSSHGDQVHLQYVLHFDVDDTPWKVTVDEDLRPHVDPERKGLQRDIYVLSRIPPGFELVCARPYVHRVIGGPRIDGSQLKWEPLVPGEGDEFAAFRYEPAASKDETSRRRIHLSYTADLHRDEVPPKMGTPREAPKPEEVTSTPGFDGVRLPTDRGIMPTAITWTIHGELAFTSLKGHVYLAVDSDGDGLEDMLSLVEEGLAAPYGIIPDGSDLIVSHKPELLRLGSFGDNRRARKRSVVATGWGYSDDYHDWTCGIVRDAEGHLYVGLGSDYAQSKRPQERSRWRGKVLRIKPADLFQFETSVTPVGHAFRYPTGLAMDAKGHIFVSDNQGVQNTFNEINLLIPGASYGVPSRQEENRDAPETKAAIQVPHPWTRSVNGLMFLPENLKAVGEDGGNSRPGSHPFAGHGIGCEYDSRFLVRFTTQDVGDVVQGAVYEFSRPNAGAGGTNFSGPLCAAVGPNGDLYIGSIHDSGWLGGQNTGEIVRLRANGKLPNGIRELRATPEGFEVEFIHAVSPDAATNPANYTISGYTRVWQGSYSTPDSGRHKIDVAAAELASDGRTVRLRAPGLREGHVYEVSCGAVDAKNEPLFPATGHYTLHRIPGTSPD